MSPQKPGQVDGQYSTAGGREGGQRGAGADAEAGSHRAPDRKRFPSNQHRDSASEVMGQAPGSHHISAWEVWQRDHQGLPNVHKEDVEMTCLPRLEFISIST